MSVRQINIFVTDLAEAQAFYGRVLGLRVKRELKPLAIELDDENISLVLHLAESSCNVGLKDVRVSIGFATSDMGASLSLLKEEGVDILTPEPQHSPFGPWIAFRDPFGNILELVAFEE